MYGLVNKAVEDLVVSRYGEDMWARIQELAKVDAVGFVSMEAYPDEVTYKLVGAASEVLGRPASALLEAFGEHWILYTAREGYGELMAMFGASMREFLGNLDNMHTRVGLSFPQLQPPSFVVRDAGPRTLELEYHSRREGLAPMVVGLLKGLARSFSEEVAVEHVHGRDRDGFDLFRVELQAAA
ncbi:heme NO-binding domain-containing protein [Nannocystis sp. SCPEA4]|uniref:heme NO-binding domain-containing protein n=1 Tax=Nannocystis sp. SCPEA4 TaxID=2996787 RepID=UPI00226E6F12|nr:heme NO-binding domain-containing protein [Nannocystis sp. SCPEA4]MCY1057401.1 heme NO-binding domain-containing protein [Nannocystis sp. SCPEA4]